MREIKFRAWDKSDGQMYYAIQDGIQFEDGSSYEFRHFLTPREDDYHKWEIMQFTGLKDKNGKEIYEGDVVRYNTGEKFIVKWIKRNASFEYSLIRPKRTLDKYINHSDETPTNNLGGHEVEIIGNIYENPELLQTN